MHVFSVAWCLGLNSIGLNSKRLVWLEPSDERSLVADLWQSGIHIVLK